MPPFLFVSLQNRFIFRFDWFVELVGLPCGDARNISTNAEERGQNICFDVAKTPPLAHDLMDLSRSYL